MMEPTLKIEAEKEKLGLIIRSAILGWGQACVIGGCSYGQAQKINGIIGIIKFLMVRIHLICSQEAKNGKSN